jgi:hypothetical protein
MNFIDFKLADEKTICASIEDISKDKRLTPFCCCYVRVLCLC